MSQQEASDARFSKWIETGPPVDDDPEIARPSTAQMREMNEAGARIARQLNGPMTALMLYMDELKHHSRQFLQGPGDRVYLQQVVENALQQTERVCAIMKQIAGSHEEPGIAPAREGEWEMRAGRTKNIRATGVMFSSDPGQKPLTKRECEVLGLVSQGYSNKQGAVRMRISPRTFESHRAEAMRKLGARNTADLVRTALRQTRAG